MKKLINFIPLSFLLLFGAACSSDSDDTSAAEDTETEVEETEIENDETDSDETEDDEENEDDRSTESEADDETAEENNEDESSDDSQFRTVSDDDQALIEEKYQGRTNDGFISSIEATNDEYSEVVVHVTDKFDHINEEGYRSKLEGIGTSIREMTSGVLYDGQEDTLPLLEFRNADDEVIGSFNSHQRDERMEFNES
jgi:hypothetical protein